MLGEIGKFYVSNTNSGTTLAILTRMMNGRLVSPTLLMLVIATHLSAAPSFAQTVPSRDQWGEKFNSPGAKLTYKDIGRTTIDGKTVITYNLFASGIPKDQHYALCVLNVGMDPRAVADAYLNGDGKVVNVMADPARHIAEDPIDAKAFGGKASRFSLP